MQLGVLGYQIRQSIFIPFLIKRRTIQNEHKTITNLYFYKMNGLLFSSLEWMTNRVLLFEVTKDETDVGQRNHEVLPHRLHDLA